MDQSSVGINRQRRVSGDRQILTVLAKAIMSSHFPACTPRMDATRRRTDRNGLLRRVLRITSEAIHGFSISIWLCRSWVSTLQRR
jgi:hypothetical protein